MLIYIGNTDWSKFFKCGRVFKTLWTDPYDVSTTKASHNIVNAIGVVVYSEVRRFVVTKAGKSGVVCL